MGIQSYFSKKWRKIVRNYCDGQYQVIDKVLPGDINYYQKCQLVATHYAIKEDHQKIALVVYRERNTYLPLVHLINFNGLDFIDNSIGEWSQLHEYRFIRWINKKEFFSTQDILSDTHEFFSSMGGFFTRTIGDNTN